MYIPKLSPFGSTLNNAIPTILKQMRAPFEAEVAVPGGFPWEETKSLASTYEALYSHLPRYGEEQTQFVKTFHETAQEVIGTHPMLRRAYECFTEHPDDMYIDYYFQPLVESMLQGAMAVDHSPDGMNSMDLLELQKLRLLRHGDIIFYTETINAFGKDKWGLLQWFNRYDDQALNLLKYYSNEYDPDSMIDERDVCPWITRDFLGGLQHSLPGFANAELSKDKLGDLYWEFFRQVTDNFVRHHLVMGSLAEDLLKLSSEKSHDIGVEHGDAIEALGKLVARIYPTLKQGKPTPETEAAVERFESIVNATRRLRLAGHKRADMEVLLQPDVIDAVDFDKVHPDIKLDLDDVYRFPRESLNVYSMEKHTPRRLLDYFPHLPA